MWRTSHKRAWGLRTASLDPPQPSSLPGRAPQSISRLAFPLVTINRKGRIDFFNAHSLTKRIGDTDDCIKGTSNSCRRRDCRCGRNQLIKTARERQSPGGWLKLPFEMGDCYFLKSCSVTIKHITV
ncbi:hypothetical protein CDAR_309811 [Caerostris darwini]|uniref:Uncharacterized protein n=1 Tax=Caerostris darwini TaxID=1538125 RepID=A0AAV4VZ87_9ARAC|nr:hypothetical protein CDAR_309811 [Caerostris darwini]